MTQRPIALAIALAFAASSALFGCDNTSNLTEQEHIQRAKDFEDQGKLNGSIIELKNAIQKNPDSPQARLLLGQVYLKVGAGAAAEKELIRARALGVNGETITPQLGEALLQMGEYKRVLDEINPNDKTSPTNLARIYQIRADAMLRQGKTQDACALFQRSLDIDKSNPPTYWGLAQCAVADQDVTKARSWLQAALKLDSRQAQSWIAIGNLEQYDKKFQASLDAYTQAVKAEPSNLEALQSRAALNMSLGNLDVAKTDIDVLTRLAPKSLGVYYLRALLNFEHKKYAEARSELDKVFKLTPDHMPSVLLAGATANAQGAYQLSESLLNRFLGRFPHHAYARRVLASTQVKQNQPNRALETLAPLLTPETSDVTALVLASDAYRLKGDSAKTAAYLERAAAIDPRNAYLQTQLGIGHLSTGDRQLAISELGKAAAIDSKDYRADFALIMARLEHKEFDQALAAVAALEKKLPNRAVTHTMRGSALVGKNDLVNARKSFEKALSIDPAFFPAAASLADLDLRDKQPAMARTRLKSVLNHDKTHLQAMLALADLAAANHQDKEAVRWLEQAARAHPEAIAPRAALVRHYLGKQDGKQALAIANEAVNVSPDNPAALELLGAVQLALGDKTGATNTFARLIQKADQSPDALLQLALAQLSANRVDDARHSLQRALALRPDHLASLDALIKLEVRDHQPEKALEIARGVQSRLSGSTLGFEREGDIQLHEKRAPLAVKAYAKAMAINPASPLAIKLHRAQTAAGNTSVADQGLVDWLQRHPKDQSARIYAAEQDRANGRIQAAIAQYRVVLQQTPQNPVALNNLAGLYQRAGDARALATAEQALKAAPESPAILDTLGWILVEQGQIRRGLALLDKAVARAPKSAGIRFHHAMALARAGDKARARAELQSLLRDAPQSPDAETARQALQKL